MCPEGSHSQRPPAGITVSYSVDRTLGEHLLLLLSLETYRCRSSADPAVYQWGRHGVSVGSCGHAWRQMCWTQFTLHCSVCWWWRQVLASYWGIEIPKRTSFLGSSSQGCPETSLKRKPLCLPLFPQEHGSLPVTFKRCFSLIMKKILVTGYGKPNLCTYNIHVYWWDWELTGHLLYTLVLVQA